MRFIRSVLRDRDNRQVRRLGRSTGGGRRGPRRAVEGLALLLTMALTACSGGGSSSVEQPVAAALVVGQGQELVHVTVRSGSEVVLNGENSDGTRFPIDDAMWRQTDSTGIAVQLVKRSELTRAFKVPQVDAPTTLTFDLTIVNQDGDRTTTPVVVDIIPVNDSNRFLDFFRSVPGSYTAVAALQPGTVTTSEVEFTITERQLVNYADRTTGVNGPVNRFNVDIRKRQSKSTRWLDGTTSDWTTQAEGVNAFYNPNLCFAVPKFDVDEINLLFDDSNPDFGIADHRRDSVEHLVELTLEVTAGSCEDALGNPIDCQDAAILYVLRTNGEIADAITATATQKTIAVDELKASEEFGVAQPLQPESAITAAAYYAAVDPLDRRLTFSDWLENAGFTDGSGNFVNSSSVAHALYINNYDLGFTRDMFVRRSEAGDVFAYVTNYPALRPATLRQDVIATVAMEYGPPDEDPSLPRIVKFFVYVPDGSGEQQRVQSLNFDGRGEKWVPGACVACHGGELKKLDAAGNYPLHGDIDAAFLPWDLDSFLYVDAADPDLVDPLVTAGFELNPQYLTPEDLAEFSRENQEDAFRRMNEMVLETMKEKPGESDRFTLVRTQIHDWYQSTDYDADTLPPVAFDGLRHIPQDWVDAGQEDVYHEVFARHCRICHSQARGINQLSNYTVLTSPAILDLIERFVYEDGLMPNARLDMDRFWVDFHGGSVAPAARLAAALGFDMNDPKFTQGPGRPIARIKGEQIQAVLPRQWMAGQIDSITTLPDVENEDDIRLDGSISGLAQSFAWRMIQRPAGSTSRLIGDDTAKPAFSVDQPGDFLVKLHVGNGRVPLPSEAELSDPGPCASTNCAIVTVIANPGGPHLAAGASLMLMIPESIPSDPTIATITQAQLEYADPDSSAADLTITVQTPPANGTLSALAFTQQDVNDGLVTYTHDIGAEGPTDSFTFLVTDETGNELPGTFQISLSPRNDEPFNLANGPLSVVEDSTLQAFFDPPSATGTPAVLRWVDFEDSSNPLAITYTLTAVPSRGTLELSGGPPLAIGASFTQADIDNAELTYTHDGTEPTGYGFADSFSYTVTDGTFDQAAVFPIEITGLDEAPQLRSAAIAVPAAREQRLRAGVSPALFLAIELAVLDTDSGADEIFLTLEDQPNTGQLEIRGGTNPRTLVLGEEFRLDEISASVAPDGLWYVNAHSASIVAPAADSFEFSVRDSAVPPNAGACSPSCVTNVTVNVRTDGPTGPAAASFTTDGILNTAVTRNGSARNSSDTPPWFFEVIDHDVELTYSDATVTGEPGETDITYTILSGPPASQGFLRLNATTLPVNGSGTFTRQNLVNNQVVYENRQIGGGNHVFTLAISDGLVTIQRNLTVQRPFNVQSDLGWVIDSVWSDAAGTTLCTPTGGATTGPRACRQCHWLKPDATRGCAVSLGAAEWTNNGVDPGGSAGGTIQCSNLSAAVYGDPDVGLPNFPTNLGDGGAVLGHSGAAVFPQDNPAGIRSWPHAILQHWSSLTPAQRCP